MGLPQLRGGQATGEGATKEGRGSGPVWQPGTAGGQPSGPVRESGPCFVMDKEPLKSTRDEDPPAHVYEGHRGQSWGGV